MHLRFNYRLKPTKEQSENLTEFGSYARGIWNLLLSENIRRYEHDGQFIFYQEMASLLKELKQFEAFAWIKAFDAAAGQQVARDLDAALNNAFSKGRLQRFPKHKVSYHKKKLHKDSFRAVNNQNCIRVEKGHISIPKIGKVPIVLHRPLVSAIKTVTVAYLNGHWQVSIVQEMPNIEPKAKLNMLVGFDINSKDTVVGSNGWATPNPKMLKRSEVKLKQIQRQLSRRKKFSRNWKKTKNKLNILHGKIKNQRAAFAHEVSCTIAKSADIVVFEDLNVKGMQQFNGRMVGDNVMGCISQMSKYKVGLQGGLFHKIGRFVKSTGICHHCLHHHSLSLNKRSFTCNNCSKTQNRDYSSAISIARTGEIDLIAVGTIVRGKPTAQQKLTGQTKVFERSSSKLVMGAEKKEAA